jgi:hypothetical protein
MNKLRMSFVELLNVKLDVRVVDHLYHKVFILLMIS